MLKKIKIFIIILILALSFSYDLTFSSLDIEVNYGGVNNSNDRKIQNGIINSVNNVSENVKSNYSIPGFFKFAKNQIYLVIWVISIFMIVWIGVRIATARGNPEEFKKAWIHLIYLIIGLFLVFASWGIISIVSNLNIF